MRFTTRRGALVAAASLVASGLLAAVGPAADSADSPVAVRHTAPVKGIEHQISFVQTPPPPEVVYDSPEHEATPATPVDPDAPVREGPPLAPESVPELLPEPGPLDDLGLGNVSAAAPSDLVVVQSTELNNSTSLVPEPVAAAGPSGVLAVWNWYAGVSTDGGSSFSYVSPWSAFPSAAGGFCCDQLAIYDKVNDQYIWILLYIEDASNNNVIRIARAKGHVNLKNGLFTYWDFSAQSFGAASGTWLDHPKIALTAGNLYMINQEIGGSSRQMVARFPLSSLSSGGSLSSTYFDAGASGAGLTQTSGTSSTMYIAGHRTTSQLRVYSWPDSGTLVFNDVNHTSYPNNFHDCSRSGGSATSNWCGKSGDNVETGAVAGGVITFAWNASSGGGGFGTFAQPYEHVVRINESTKALIDEPYVYNSTLAFQYFSLGVNASGHLGGTYLWGGGSSGNYLNCGILLRDGYTSGSGFNLWGWDTSNADPDEAVAGDYLFTAKHGGGPHIFSGTCYRLSGGGAASNVRPKFLAFGREQNLPPRRPATLSAAPGTNNGEIKLTWTAPSSSGGAAITGYRIHRASSTGQATFLTSVGNVLTYTDTGRPAGTTWYYQVSAVTSLGESPLSLEASSLPKAPASPPSAPRNLTAVPGTANGQIRLSWLAPTSNGGATITTYRLCRGTTSGSYPTCVNLSGSTFSYTQGGLTVLTQPYYFRVYAINSAGTGPGSNTACTRPYPWLAELGCGDISVT